MLRLENIVKKYQLKDSEVVALKGISLCFRKNEFVSILGPSGCGKTTLLNILGGLDHYDEGDLVICGKSTKEFKDRDWDIYRNHRIGFIFQAYNLIPHENILENVELALTIAGISKEERVKKAQAALDKVGLKDMYKKKPNQLSGGQCQRVAIARALVNEPEILLADEPTGALDSVTSVQIMELIKEISKEKLVIMVTHNPDLAEKYSTRIVRLLDGELLEDSNPYTAEEEKKEDYTQYESIMDKEKAKMSFWTAFKLSAKNLWSKAQRTAMVTVAASIGIVGVSAVLAVSSGVTNYINNIQDEMLSGNPISVSESTLSLSSLMSGMSLTDEAEAVRSSTKDGYVDVDFMIKRLIDSADSMGSAMIENTITEDYVSYVDDMPTDYYAAISKNYGIDVTNNIYTDDLLDGNDSREFYSLSSLGKYAKSILSKTDYGSYSSLVDSYTDTFYQSIDNEDYILEQYDILDGGRYATAEDEIMIVLNDDAQITDFTLTLLGYYSQSDFMTCIHKFNGDEITEEQEATFEENKKIALETLMNKDFYYYPNNTVYTTNNGASADDRPFYYSYQPESDWEGMKMKVVGVLVPKEGRQYSSLSTGFYYTPAFTQKYLNDNYDSDISNYIRDYIEENDGASGISSSVTTFNGMTIKSGIYYEYDFMFEDEWYHDTAMVGSTSSLSAMMAAFMGSGASSSSATLSLRNVGGNKLPRTIKFYPRSFDDKYLVTDYLTAWNSDDIITVNGKETTKEDRGEDIDYVDNLEVIISMINTMINIVTIALICFTALSLVVSTVMIGIITYVSVIERIKEIGVIRALGGRKKDVSHLFNAETFIIGFLSGLFGILVTYLLQLIVNIIVHANFSAISMIADLPILTAAIVILVSVLLTSISGLVPASVAARKDPVLALRSE